MQRGAALCCRAGRLEAAQRRQLVALAPPLAVRAGVGATEAEEAATEPCEHVAGQERPWQKKQKREKKPPPPRPTHFLALQARGAAAEGRESLALLDNFAFNQLSHAHPVKRMHAGVAA